MRSSRRLPTPGLVALATILAAQLAAGACRSRIDPVAALEPVDVVTGWFDAGIVEAAHESIEWATLA